MIENGPINENHPHQPTDDLVLECVDQFYWGFVKVLEPLERIE